MNAAMRMRWTTVADTAIRFHARDDVDDVHDVHAEDDARARIAGVGANDRARVAERVRAPSSRR